MTKRSRGTANAWHFYYALVFCGYDVIRKLVSGVGCPLTRLHGFPRLSNI
ncbi:glutathione S-transferase, partial [Vibrio paracholerae]